MALYSKWTSGGAGADIPSGMDNNGLWYGADGQWFF